ncbi:NADPH:quinone reductase [Thermoflavimicrobium dichotomicum]|uniref:NADPH:quinone reductase n=2 Tax=Thermoflavimicrobium dichotomicum TaxID=46223 RepID=A0A1I3P0H0_9BACL|nr:NADPH:quinone reductase [Thermoflavimicrobium dichotomicum]
MKAAVLREIGGPQQVRIEEASTPVLKPDELLIRIKFAALNRRDVWITHGLYPGMQLPAILGSDGAGEIVAIGEQVTDLQIGDAVIINPALNWGDNPHFNGPDFSILGMPQNGTFAQYVAVSHKQVYPKPNHLTWEEAAALPLAGLTAYRALVTRGQIQKNETVFIPGIGSGVALFALQMAVTLGAKVFVSSSSDEKLEKAIKLGATGGVNYRSENWAKELKKQMGGADLIIDCVGGDTFNQLLNLAKPGGRIVNFGATTGPVPKLLLPKLFFKHLDIRGTTMGSPQDFAGMLELITNHQIHPVLDRSFLLEEIQEALFHMEKGNHFGKITVKIPEEK